MKIAHPWKCDYCSITKGQANHWFMRDVAGDVFILGQWDETEADNQLLGGKPAYEHICGIECAAKALNKWAGGATT